MKYPPSTQVEVDEEGNKRPIVQVHKPGATYAHCTQCGGKFLVEFSRAHVLCLDCRGEISERSTHDGEMDLVDRMDRVRGSRLQEGFGMMRDDE